MGPLIGQILLFLLDVAFWIIIIQVVLSWLITFDVINIRNPQASRFVMFIDRLTAPVFTPLRRMIPPIAGIDITPIAVIFAIYLLKNLVFTLFF
jgi:YggT family protein